MFATVQEAGCCVFQISFLVCVVLGRRGVGMGVGGRG